MINRSKWGDAIKIKRMRLSTNVDVQKQVGCWRESYIEKIYLKIITEKVLDHLKLSITKIFE